MTLTKKFEQDAMHSFNKDDSQEWKNIVKENNIDLSIDNRDSDFKLHTIDFTLFDNRGNLLASMCFSRHTRKYIECKVYAVRYGKTIKIDRSKKILEKWTNFIVEMVKHGYLE